MGAATIKLQMKTGKKKTEVYMFNFHSYMFFFWYFEAFLCSHGKNKTKAHLENLKSPLVQMETKRVDTISVHVWLWILILLNDEEALQFPLLVSLIYFLPTIPLRATGHKTNIQIKHKNTNLFFQDCFCQAVYHDSQIHKQRCVFLESLYILMIF